LQYHIFAVLSSLFMILITLETHFRALPSCFHFHTIPLLYPYPWEGKHAKNEKRKGKKRKDKRKKTKDKKKEEKKKGNNGRLTPAKKKHTKKRKEKRNHKAPKKNINLQPF